MASFGPSFAGYTPGGELPPEIWQQLASLYSNPTSLQALRDMNGGGSEYIDRGTGLTFAPRFKEINGSQIFDGGTVYNSQNPDQGLGHGAYSTAGSVYDANGRFAQPFQINKTPTDFMDRFGFLIPLAAPFAFSALAGAGAAGGAAGGAASGATTAPVLGSTGALTGTQLGALGAGAGGVGLASGAAGAAGAAGGASLLSSLGGWSSLIGPAASLIGGALQSSAAGDAADAMSNAAQAGIGEQRREFDTVRELLSPYVQAGNTSLGAYQALSGAQGPDAQRAAMAALEASPQFGSMTKAGENAILQNASATGGLRGGNIQAALYDHRAQLLNGLAQQQLGNYLPIVNSGQASAAGVGSAAMQTGSNVANLLGQQGAAQAGGIVAGTNAITGTLGNIGGFFAGQQAGNVAPNYGGAPVNLNAGMNFGSGVVPSYSNGGNLF